MAGSQNLLTPGPADGLAVGRQGPRSRLCLRTRLLPALTRPPALAGRPLRERGPAMQDGLDDYVCMYVFSSRNAPQLQCPFR